MSCRPKRRQPLRRGRNWKNRPTTPAANGISGSLCENESFPTVVLPDGRVNARQALRQLLQQLNVPKER